MKWYSDWFSRYQKLKTQLFDVSVIGTAHLSQSQLYMLHEITKFEFLPHGPSRELPALSYIKYVFAGLSLENWDSETHDGRICDLALKFPGRRGVSFLIARITSIQNQIIRGNSKLDNLDFDETSRRLGCSATLLIPRLAISALRSGLMLVRVKLMVNTYTRIEIKWIAVRSNHCVSSLTVRWSPEVLVLRATTGTLMRIQNGLTARTSTLYYIPYRWN